MENYLPYISQLGVPQQSHLYAHHNWSVPSSYIYASAPAYNVYNGYYQYPYPYPYQQQLAPQVISTNSTSNRHQPTMQYSNGCCYVHFSYPEEMTIILDEDGEIVDDYSQFYDQDTLKKNLVSREETISKHLKTRIHVQSKDPTNSKEPEICVICQAEYEDDERIGRIECGHEYHAGCIKRWLLHNIVCPICKTTALATN